VSEALSRFLMLPIASQCLGDKRRSGRQLGDLAAGGLKLVHDHGVFAFRRDHGRSKRPNTSHSNSFFGPLWYLPIIDDGSVFYRKTNTRPRKRLPANRRMVGGVMKRCGSSVTPDHLASESG
jgi:hypothetical protein